MRANHRVIRVVAAFAVLALSALVPGPVTAGGATSDDGTPGVSLLIRLFDPPAPKPQAAKVPAPVVAEARKPRPDTKVQTLTKPVAEAAEPVAEAEVDPSQLVRSMDVLEFDAARADREETSAATTGPCPKSTTCQTNSVRPVKWKTDKTGKLTIPWKFSDVGRRNLRAPAGLLESAVRNSMAEWSKWNSNISFPYEGTTTATFGADGKDGSCDDGTNTVTWHRFDPSIIAAVVTCTDPAGKTIRDTDLALNVTQHWEDIRGEPESRHTFDISSIVTHELGHWLSLLDLYDEGSLRQTMMGNAKYGETRKRTLALGDILGLQKAYPCGDGDSCPRKGMTND